MMNEAEAESVLARAMHNPKYLQIILAIAVMAIPGGHLTVDMDTVEDQLADKGLAIKFTAGRTMELFMVDKPPSRIDYVFPGGEA